MSNNTQQPSNQNTTNQNQPFPDLRSYEEMAPSPPPLNSPNQENRGWILYPQGGVCPCIPPTICRCPKVLKTNTQGNVNNNNN